VEGFLGGGFEGFGVHGDFLFIGIATKNTKRHKKRSCGLIQFDWACLEIFRSKRPRDGTRLVEGFSCQAAIHFSILSIVNGVLPKSFRREFGCSSASMKRRFRLVK